MVAEPDKASKQDPVHIRRGDGFLAQLLERKDDRSVQKKRKRGDDASALLEDNSLWSWFTSWGTSVKVPNNDIPLLYLTARSLLHLSLLPRAVLLPALRGISIKVYLPSLLSMIP